MFDKEYSFTGKHAEYVKDLKEKAQLFDRNLDVYILAPIIGFLYGRIGTKDSGETTTKIFGDQLRGEQLKLKFNYRLLMILDDSDDLSEEEKIDRVFRDSGDEEILRKNMELYNSYVLGGLEYLHEKVYKEGLKREEYINRLADFIEDFNDDLESRVSNEDIIEIISKYE